MMAGASSGNPYENYDNTEIEQDLMDPGDGILTYKEAAAYTDVNTSN